MARDPRIILSEIRILVDELESVLGGGSAPHKRPDMKKASPVVVPKGSAGAMTILIEEGFFDTPKEIASIMKKLREIGHYHKAPTIGMRLLNLTRKRILTRFQNKSTKNWEYVIRK